MDSSFIARSLRCDDSHNELYEMLIGGYGGTVSPSDAISAAPAKSRGRHAPDTNAGARSNNEKAMGRVAAKLLDQAYSQSR